MLRDRDNCKNFAGSAALANYEGEGIKRCFCLTSVCLSVTYIGPNSRTDRPRKTKLGTEVARASHVTRTPLSGLLMSEIANMLEQVPPGEEMRRYCQLAGAQAYCVATQWRNNRVDRVDNVQGPPSARGPPSSRPKKNISI